MGMSAVTDTGDRAAQLRELARTLALWMDSCESARDMASLARQYRETIRELEDIYRETIRELEDIGGIDAEDGLAQIISRRAAG